MSINVDENVGLKRYLAKKQRREDVRVLMTQDEKLKMVKKGALDSPDKKRAWMRKLLEPASSGLHEVSLTKFEVRLMGIDYEQKRKKGAEAEEEQPQVERRSSSDLSDSESEAPLDKKLTEKDEPENQKDEEGGGGRRRRMCGSRMQQSWPSLGRQQNIPKERSLTGHWCGTAGQTRS
jgi:hypothetical protein